MSGNTLSDVHRSYLNDHAITDEVIEAQGIRSDGDVIVFTWRNRDLVTEQRRLWPEPLEGLPLDAEGKPMKYVWATGKPPHFNVARDPTPNAAALIVEGTKQHLAVAGYADERCAVYGMVGCWGWSKENLSRFKGREVVIMLDADAATKQHVYDGGAGLAENLRALGASVFFARMPTVGKAGADDYLATLKGDNDEETAEIRRDVLQRLVTKAVSDKVATPAARKPKATPDLSPAADGRPVIVVNRDRQQVIHEIISQLQARWSGTELFCYGGALTRLRDGKTEPLSKDAFLRWLAEGISCVSVKITGPEASWPDPQTVGAVLASADEFAPLERVARVPFVRPDGTICTTIGYDQPTATMLAGANGWRPVPDHPSQADAQAAAGWLLGEWLGDMPFRDQASQANALALILTPFIRGLVPLAPFAVVSGLQMGVGKNLFADCMSILVDGHAAIPMPYVDDEEETRKQLTSAFRAGTNLFCFDEAHVIQGAQLSRAVTSITYSDRILGASLMASFPNNVTWMSLGNQVQVNSDMSRRVYFTEMYPNCPDPQDRPESAFRHPDLRGWTLENRPELVTAALTILRAWFAAGKPPHSRGSLMGSFEAWDKLLSGALAYAGVPGFLGNVTDKRGETDLTGQYWRDHLAWLHTTFGDEPFTAQQVRNAAIGSAGSWDSPPGMDDVMKGGFVRNLGAAYARNQDRWYATMHLVKDGMGHGNVVKWRAVARDEIPNLSPQIPPLQVGEGIPNSPALEVGGDRGDEGSHSRTYAREDSPRDNVTTDGARFSLGNGVVGHPTIPPSPQTGVSLSVDLETADAGQLFTYQPHDETGFVRIAGALGPDGEPRIMSGAEVLPLLDAATEIVGHNFLGFDLLALAWHHGADWDRLSAKVRDTELIARQADPPRSRESGTSEDRYGLDQVAERLGVPGKTDNLPRLKAAHGGYDKIPVDDPEYRAYLGGDLRATQAVGALLHNDAYTVREHRLASLAGRMTLNGFMVDAPLLAERLEQGQTRKHDALQLLHDAWGLPLGRNVFRGRGAAKHEEFEIAESPLATDFGREWLDGFWSRYGIADPPRTAKAGKLAIGGDDLAAVAARPGAPEGLKSALRLMGIITGTRTVYQTATDCLCADGRVHPTVSMRQASGRWSVTNPGLTVFGKRGGKHVEREIFLPDPGHVLLSFDLSQVDMRSIAGHCQDPAYMALFEPGRDAHSEIAAQVGIDRQAAKAIGHGWNYGLGAKRMIANGLDAELVNRFTSGMEERFPILMAWREQIRAEAGAGMILDNGFGRRMRADPARAYTVAPALMGQGGARDIMCESLLRIPPELWVMLRVMVHDEILMSVPKAEAMEVAQVVKRAMTWTWRNVPITCDMAVGMNWGQCSEH